MPKLSEVVLMRAEFAAEMGSGVMIKGHYKPYEITPQVQAEIGILDDDPPKKAARKLCTTLVKILVDWDLTGDDDKPIPLDVDTLVRGVPLRAIGRVLKACNDDQDVGE